MILITDVFKAIFWPLVLLRRAFDVFSVMAVWAFMEIGYYIMLIVCPDKHDFDSREDAIDMLLPNFHICGRRYIVPKVDYYEPKGGEWLAILYLVNKHKFAFVQEIESNA